MIYVDGGTTGSRICLVDNFKQKIITKFRGNKPTKIWTKFRRYH